MIQFPSTYLSLSWCHWRIFTT